MYETSCELTHQVRLCMQYDSQDMDRVFDVVLQLIDIGGDVNVLFCETANVVSVYPFPI